MKKILLAVFLIICMITTVAQTGTITLSKQQLKDKIKGGWAGQTIGVTFGGPYEFQFNGTFIGDYQPLKWYDGHLKHTMINNPGLYDDLYMDITFVDVFEKYGLDAPVDSFANAYANAGYMLWHANQAGRWKMGLKEAESIDFKYTTMSLDDVYETGFNHAIKNIERNGGKQADESVTINVQQPKTVKFEKSFTSLFPIAKIPVKWSDDKAEISFEFEGTGFVLRGETAKWASESNYIFNTELYVDDKLIESPKLPANYITRRYELCWKYDLPKGKHKVRLKILNPSVNEKVNVREAIVYSDKPVTGISTNNKAAN